MRGRFGRTIKGVALAAVSVVVLASCSAVVNGTANVENAPNADLNVKGGDSSSNFDTVAQNALSDIEGFWKQEFPSVANGKPLEPLKGGYFSVDGLKVAQNESADGMEVEENECAQQSVEFLIDNAAYCRLDDSVVWDRADTHLFAKLADKYGDFTTALVMAHEIGHSIQQRLDIFDDDPATALTESQADCAAGAWTRSVIDQRAPHFRNITMKDVDSALAGFLYTADRTPEAGEAVSHGNGFDRLSAVAAGYDRGVQYCYSDGYFDSRTFTSRPYASPDDEASGGNLPLSQVVDTSSQNILVTDLNRYWTSAAKSIGKQFQPVKIAQADHPKCDSGGTVEFGYCASDNTVYFSSDIAQQAYNSLAGIELDRDTGDATLLSNQPADFALGTLFSMGWGMAVRHQLFDRELTGGDALEAAVCYTGAYSKNINTDKPPGDFVLSPADLDESVSALLHEVPQDTVFGPRETTGLERIQAFFKGYKGSLSVC